MDQVVDAITTGAGMLWKALWALIFGYIISAGIQVLVTREQMARLLGRRGAKQAALASFFGFVSSSCSFAALAASRSVFAKGAHPVNATAFLISSTNLVIELGIVLWVLVGWRFTAANFAVNNHTNGASLSYSVPMAVIGTAGNDTINGGLLNDTIDGLDGHDSIDASAGAVEKVEHILAQIRAHWPETRIILRAASGFARDALMAWAEQHRVDHVGAVDPRRVARAGDGLLDVDLLAGVLRREQVRRAPPHPRQVRVTLERLERRRESEFFEPGEEPVRGRVRPEAHDHAAFLLPDPVLAREPVHRLTPPRGRRRRFPRSPPAPTG